MFSIVRRSQLIDLDAIGHKTATRSSATVQEVWIDVSSNVIEGNVTALFRGQSIVFPEDISADIEQIVDVPSTQIIDVPSTSIQHDQTGLKKATKFVQDRWHDLSQSLSHVGNRMKNAVSSAGKHLVTKNN